MDRRSFLKVSAGGIAGLVAGIISWSPRAEAATISKTFYITDGTATPFIDNVPLYWRAFSQDTQLNHLDIPGEFLVVQEGDTVNIRVVNTLSTSHSFVIDGLVDSGTIRGGRTANLSFTAGNPGTHMYYDKLNAPYNRMIGLHGAMAVMPRNSGNELYPGSRTFKKQMFWVFNDIDPAWNQAISRGRTPSTEYKPRYFTLNGLAGRPPGSAGSGDPALDAMHDHRTALHGSVGDRTLIRVLNAGLCTHSIHTHANHMEWLSENSSPRPDVWIKDIVPLDGNKGSVDVIFPYEPPPDAYPAVSTGKYPMHLHNEQTQTAAGGYYMFGAMTDIFFE